MKHFVRIFFLFAFSITSTILGCNIESESKKYAFYLKVGTGVSASQSANIVAVYPPWNPADQGYNASLGSCPIASLSVGCELKDILDLEANLSNRAIFKYRKLQTPTAGGDSYTREFDLNITSIMFSANLLGKGFNKLNWDFACGKFYPIIGVGVGTSYLLITNFRTTGLPATGDSAPYLSFSAENQYTLRKNFTYTVLAGLEYSYQDDWAINTGYRWFNAGHFQGPQYLRTNTGAAVDVGSNQWDMRFRANEWFVEFKIYI